MHKTSTFIQDTHPTYNPSLIITHGNGDFVFDEQGKKYIDFCGGIAVNLFGHRWDIIGPAVKKQMTKLIHCSNYFTTEAHLNLCVELAQFANNACKTSYFKTAYISNSGTEANEAALKFARLIAKYKSANAAKFEIISFSNGFHGRTMGSLSVTAKKQYKEPFNPLIPGCAILPFNNSEALEEKASSTTAAIIVEPIQGEGGLEEISPHFAETITKVSKKHGIIIIADEVQTGLYRTGKALACAHYNLQPDIVTLAKSLGGGLPIGATIIHEDIASLISPGDHGSTMGGNPVICAAAQSVLKKLSHKLTQIEITTSAYYLEKCINKLIVNIKKQDSNITIEKLGQGHLRGITLPPTCKASDILTEAQNKGLLILRTGENAIRFAPSLICQPHIISQAIKILQSVIIKAIKQKTHDK